MPWLRLGGPNSRHRGGIRKCRDFPLPTTKWKHVKINIGIAGTLTAFDDDTVGTKVTAKGEFLEILRQAITKDGDTVLTNENPDYAGSGFFALPSDAFHTVRCGVAMKEGLTSQDKHIKNHRGDDLIFALPRCAAPLTELTVLVYTIDKYLSDPEVQEKSEECEALLAEEVSHVIVAIHAGPGERSSHRLVRAIAGDSLDFPLKSKVSEDGTELNYSGSDLEADVLTAHKMVKASRATKAFERVMIYVADRDDSDD